MNLFLLYFREFYEKHQDNTNLKVNADDIKENDYYAVLYFAEWYRGKIEKIDSNGTIMVIAIIT